MVQITLTPEPFLLKQKTKAFDLKAVYYGYLAVASRRTQYGNESSSQVGLLVW